MKRKHKRRAHNRLPDELVARMHADYLAGMPVKELSAKYQKHYTSIWGAFRLRGLKRREHQHVMPLRLPAGLVESMYRDYQSGLSLSAVARKYGRGRESARNLFLTRKLPIRHIKTSHAFDPLTGCWLPKPRHTPEQIQAFIDGATRITVPASLKWEWRLWPMPRRVDFIHRLRARLNSPNDRPATPFSANVSPFEYGTPAAIEIARRLNAGRTSRTKRCQLKPTSQGVIFRGQLFFWTHKAGYVHWGGWKPQPGQSSGRPALHHIIWRELHGPVPPAHTVVFRDGNKNNLDPSNLVLKARADNARENRARGRLVQSRKLTSVLLHKFQAKSKAQTKHDHLSQLHHIVRTGRNKRGYAPTLSSVI